ncbi:MAG: hypothetical protein ACPGES_09435 [Coraliomargarita sp.]
MKITFGFDKLSADGSCAIKFRQQEANRVLVKTANLLIPILI